MWPNPPETADLVTFNQEILYEKLHFLCSEHALCCVVLIVNLKIRQKVYHSSGFVNCRANNAHMKKVKIINSYKYLFLRKFIKL